MPNVVFNDEDLKASLSEALQDAGRHLLEGAAHDLQVYVEAISVDLSQVWTIADPDQRQKVYEELLGQLRAVGELNRIRASNAAWVSFTRVVRIATRTLISGVLAV